MILLIPILTFSFLLLFAQWRKPRGASPGTFIGLAFLANALLALLIQPWMEQHFNAMALLYYTFHIGICLLPFLLIDITNEPSFPRGVALHYLKIFSWAVAAVGILSVAYFFPDAVATISRDVAVVRSEVYAESFDIGPIGNIFYLFSGIWLLALSLAIIWWVNVGLTPLTIALCVASSGSIIFNLLAAGRSGIVSFAISFILLALIFKKGSKAMLRRRLALVGLLLGIVVVSIVYSAYVAYARGIGNVERYAHTQFENPIMQSFSTMAAYGGESVGNFCEFWEIRWDDDYVYYGGRQFPVLFGALERLGVFEDYSYAGTIADVMERYADHGRSGAMFSSFLRELIVDFGIYGASVICIAFSLLSWYALRRFQRTRSLEDYLLVSFLGSFFLFGILFSIWSSLPGNGAIVFMLASYVVLRRLKRRSPATKSERIRGASGEPSMSRL